MSKKYKKELYELNKKLKEMVIEIVGENLDNLNFEFLDDYSDYIESDNEYKKIKFIETYLKDIKLEDINSSILNVEIIVKTENFFRYAPEESDEEKERIILESIKSLLENKKIDFYGKNIKIKVSDQYNTNGLSIEDFCYEVNKKRIEEAKEILRNDNKLNIFNSSIAIEAFENLAHAQRNYPEEAMLTAQRVLKGGVLSDLIEHIGDLTHRASERVYTASNYEGSLENIEPKVIKGLKRLTSEYGFEREWNENIESNYKFYMTKELDQDVIEFKNRYNSIEEFRKDIDNKLIEYALEHEKLEVYNHFQYACKMSAIALGLKKFDMAANYLSYLNNMIDDPVNYIKLAGEYDKDYLVNKKYKTLEENLQNEKAFSIQQTLESIKIKRGLEEKELEKSIKDFTCGYCAEFAIALQEIIGGDIGIYQALYIENKEEYEEELSEGIVAGSSESMATNYESCHAFLIIGDKILDVKGLRDLQEEEMYFSNKNILNKRILNTGDDIELLESFMGTSVKEKIEEAKIFINKHKIKYIEQIENNKEREEINSLQNGIKRVKIRKNI